MASAAVRAIPFSDNPESSVQFGLRNQFSEIIAEDVQKKHGDRVTFFYNHKCTVCPVHLLAVPCVHSSLFQEVLFGEKKLVIEDSAGNIIEEGYDLLIAADGVHSIVRQKLQEYDHSFEVERFTHGDVYVMIRDLSYLDDEGMASHRLQCRHPKDH